MKRFGFCLWALTAIIWFAPAHAIEFMGELELIRTPILEHDTYHGDQNCESRRDFRLNEDQPNFFNFQEWNCLGRYSFTLRGDAGSTVTLFGKINFDPERGFLIVRKRDPELIWVDNLDQIPAGQWITRDSQNGYGAFDVYFAKAPQFSQNIASIKWGTWWQTKPGEGAVSTGPLQPPELPAGLEVKP